MILGLLYILVSILLIPFYARLLKTNKGLNVIQEAEKILREGRDRTGS